jgi:hypothetical protein
VHTVRFRTALALGELSATELCTVDPRRAWGSGPLLVEWRFCDLKYWRRCGIFSDERGLVVYGSFKRLCWPRMLQRYVGGILCRGLI